MDDKVIVTHRAALSGKYGTKGLAKIHDALKALIAADATRGVKTRIVYLDDSKAMKKFGAKPLEVVPDFRAAKSAIDAVFKKLHPDYLMILGAPDVVPHQDLTNPVFTMDPKANGDDDPKAWGDLPYACDAGYGRDPAQFVGPTRVVGRLPDLTGATDPSHLLALLKTATGWKSRPASDYSTYFGLSTFDWQGSTKLSLDNIFGNNGALLLSPESGPKYPKGELGARMHFINCHGGTAVPEFYGQKGDHQPTSLHTKATAKAIRAGTVAAVECCYGAELYDSVTLELDMPICQSYLRQGAYGYLGSTTVAYGPEDDNGLADLICRYFLLQVLSGASLGRAALMARQQYVGDSSQMDPFDLKTLAQFCLYGDPSVHPVAEVKAPEVPKGVKVETTERFRRSERRAKLKQTGDFLQQTKPTASKKQQGGRAAPTAKSALENIAAKNGLSRKQSFAAYKVKGVKAAKGGGAKAVSAPSRYFVTVGRPKAKKKGVKNYRIAVVAKEVAGRIIDYRIYHER